MASVELVAGWALLLMLGYILASGTELVGRAVGMPVSAVVGARRKMDRNKAAWIGGMGLGIYTGPIIVQLAGGVIGGLAGGIALSGLTAGTLSKTQFFGLVAVVLLILYGMFIGGEEEDDD